MTLLASCSTAVKPVLERERERKGAKGGTVNECSVCERHEEGRMWFLDAFCRHHTAMTCTACILLCVCVFYYISINFMLKYIYLIISCLDYVPMLLLWRRKHIIYVIHASHREVGGVWWANKSTGPGGIRFGKYAYLFPCWELDVKTDTALMFSCLEKTRSYQHKVKNKGDATSLAIYKGTSKSNVDWLRNK